ncbi:MAG TPA: glutathione S-transferase N-terminal domain-containing protein [Gammaproteobacteria bacterium]
MPAQPFKAKAYLKEGCPFSFKFLLFMTEAGLLDRIEIVRLRPDDPSFEETKARLAEGLGKRATFPTVEVEPGRYMSDSDRLIEHFAERYGARPDEMPVLSFYKQTIFPQVVELHRRKEAEGRE